jgi:adenylate cyclase
VRTVASGVLGSGLATLVLLGIAVAELIALVVVTVLLIRSRRQITKLRRRVDRPPRPGPRTAAGRAMKAVVETAARVRDQGVGGLLMSSLEDLTRWATEDRAQIARVAAPDGTVTILFSDIEDSTALNEQLGDARWIRLLDSHDALVRRLVEKQRGHVVKSQGDGFMVVFGDAAAAARAAVEIQNAFDHGASARLRRTPIKVRIGLHVGTAVARDGDYFGRNVAMAARVAAEARGGEILVSDDLRQVLNEDEFVLVPHGEVELKGLAGDHTLWELQAG